MKKILLAFVVIATITRPATAQETMQVGPGPEMKAMAWMVGNWNGTIEWTMPGMPPEKLSMPMKMEWDGAFIKSSSTMEMGPMKIIENSMMWWDPVKKRYTMITFTNFAATPRIEHGTWSKDTLVMISEPWDAGMPEGPTISRATITKKSDSEISFTIEFKIGDKWEKAGTGSFSKKKSD